MGGEKSTERGKGMGSRGKSLRGVCPVEKGNQTDTSQITAANNYNKHNSSFPWKVKTVVWWGGWGFL